MHVEVAERAQATLWFGAQVENGTDPEAFNEQHVRGCGEVGCRRTEQPTAPHSAAVGARCATDLTEVEESDGTVSRPLEPRRVVAVEAENCGVGVHVAHGTERTSTVGNGRASAG